MFEYFRSEKSDNFTSVSSTSEARSSPTPGCSLTTTRCHKVDHRKDPRIIVKGSCNKSVNILKHLYFKLISGCARMAYDSLLRTEGHSKLSTDLLQVDC